MGFELARSCSPASLHDDDRLLAGELDVERGARIGLHALQRGSGFLAALSLGFAGSVAEPVPEG